ncbi:MAG TPA: SPFH domain-containing protein [Candidatus Coproplasma avicola]|uniref:SPFH domain-containing protein n=1 Tax=Candidatus Coproplasma avicola TaxID=2840744 RepID=A0A9D1J8K3_9FIRM|nr:SPFH domain-containing protein [Candidatus Coproplasma avicola]
MALLNVIEWVEQSPDEIIHKFDTRKNIVKRGSKLTVREGQTVVFCDNGTMADVFKPGMYKLDTDTLPILTALLSWAYAFESPFKSDIYFVSTRQFVNHKWGTATPVIINDSSLGAVRVRGYGTYSFRVSDAFTFLKELSGARPSFRTSDVEDYIRSMLVMGISDALGSCGIGVADMSANLIELSASVLKSLAPRFKALGMELSTFNFESLSLPPEVEKAIDENARLGVLRGNADLYARIARADAMVEAAKNPGAGSIVGAGLGLGIGADLGREITQSASGGSTCPECGAQLPANAKFCPECGTSLSKSCPGCGARLSAGTKFCPECGAKIQ